MGRRRWRESERRREKERERGGRWSRQRWVVSRELGPKHYFAKEFEGDTRERG